VTALTGAAHSERAPDTRLTHRNGYRERRWDTRVGTIELAIPRVRDGSYLPSLLEPRRRVERALLAVVSEAYVLGVSTRRVEDLVGRSGSPRSPRARSPACAPRSMPRSRPSGSGR
jgi:transposase-like protein